MKVFTAVEDPRIFEELTEEDSGALIMILVMLELRKLEAMGSPDDIVTD